VAAVAAWRTRTLASRAAEESLRRERAVRDLGLVLEGHHDAKGVLTSALLHSHRLLELMRGPADRDRMEAARRLAEDLDVLAGCVEHVRQDADGRLLASLPLGEVDLGQGLAGIVANLGPALPDLDIELALPEGAVRAMVAGHTRGLSRVLWNLLKNAHDGDGRGRASRVRLAVGAGDGQALLVVEDDGPGFSGGAASAKPDALGVGLESVRTIVEGSGGRLELGGSELGGACVRVRLPLARQTLSKERA
jgi:signal transduction histidine kinase